jgi:surfeit locus 1 family protein
MLRSKACFLKGRSSQAALFLTKPIPTIDSNELPTIQSRSIATKKKYSKNPPIDLNKVRTRSHDHDNQNDESKKPGYGFVLLALPMLTFGLGCWQLQRREWKLDLIKFLNERTTVEPKELPTSSEELDALKETSEFYPFKVKGHFIHSKEILLSPKHDQTGTNTLPGGLIITPFVVSGHENLTIIVNRGYVPYTHYLPAKRQEGQIEGEIELIGLVRKDEITSAFTPINKPPTEWHFRDIGAMAKSMGTAPIFLDEVRSSSVKGGPLGGQTAINLRNEHMSYVITWFTLTFFTTFLWWQKFGKVLPFRKVK